MTTAPLDPPLVAPSRSGSDFAALRRELCESGLLTPRPMIRARRLLGQLVLLGISVVLFVRLGNSWFQLLTAGLFAFVFGQLGFLGHEAAHRQVLAKPWANRLLGLAGSNLLIGLSCDWWTAKHNRHHANPNTVELDPDIGTGVLAWTPEQVHARRGPARWFARHQAVFFFPLLLLEGLNLQIASIVHLCGPRARHRVLELSLLVLHLGGFVLVLTLQLSLGRALAFVAVQQGFFGLYLGCSFAPNHIGMEVFDAQCRPDFLRRQVLSSRNVRGGGITSFLFGGLNLQIEHHLFPHLPASTLRRCSPTIRDFCRRHDLPYTEASAWTSYVDVLRHLRHVARVGPSR